MRILNTITHAAETTIDVKGWFARYDILTKRYYLISKTLNKTFTDTYLAEIKNNRSLKISIIIDPKVV